MKAFLKNKKCLIYAEYIGQYAELVALFPIGCQLAFSSPHRQGKHLETQKGMNPTGLHFIQAFPKVSIILSFV
jgi:hypothetical protein